MNKRPATTENNEIDEGNPQRVETIAGELSEEELNTVSGGIIFVGGHNSAIQQSKSSITHSDRQTLNPQPIPPGKNQLPGV